MNRPHVWTILVIVAALAGLFFAGFSTYDFVAHLDRQVHGIHCSFIPGIEDTDATGSTGCHVTLMSPYSSVMRASIWGGLPISLPAMSVFAFLLFYAASLPILGRQRDRRATLFLLLGTLVPVGASAVMGYLSLVTLDAACKLCIGIYASSGLSFVGALLLFLRARREDDEEAPAGGEPVGWGRLAVAFAIGVLFVAVPTVVYAGTAPDFERYVGECGELERMPSEDLLVPLGPQNQGVNVVEVFDPLCPACKGFEERFDAQAASAEVNRRVLLFPLDDECNWMVDDAIHAGACAISEAVLCARDTSGVEPEEVIDWAFTNQLSIREGAEADPDSAAQRARDRFPALAECIGSPQARAQLNNGLRFAVDNQMPIITPQVFVNGLRMCDEDTDLGMDFALRRLIDRAEADGIRPWAEEGDSIAAPEPAPAPSGRRTRPTIQLRPNTEASAMDAETESAEPETEPSDEAAETETAETEAGGEESETVEEPTPTEPAPPEGDEAAEPPGPSEMGPGTMGPSEMAAPAATMSAEEAPQ
jgi:uncharacterized membrane protein